MKRILASLLALFIVAAPAYAGNATSGASADGASSSTIVFEGKLAASLKRQVLVPFQGVVTELEVAAGQHVKKGQVLCRLRLDRDVVIKLSRSLSPARTIELKLEIAKLDREIAQLEKRRGEVEELSKQSMAPASILDQIAQDVSLLNRQRAAVAEQLSLERSYLGEQRAALAETLSVPVSGTKVPREVTLVAPIDGYVLWMDSSVRKGSALAPQQPAFVLGRMNPMVVRARVFEAEASRLNVGDRADLVVESLRDSGVSYTGEVSRISWAPLTPGLDKPSYYEVELTADNTDDITLKDGYKVRVTIK